MLGSSPRQQVMKLREAHREKVARKNHRLVRHYFDLLNRNDLSGLGELVSADVVFFGPRAPEGIYGREAFIEFIAALHQELPDLRFAVGEMVAEGSRVASVFTMTSTHSSEQGRVKVIATEGMDLFHIADGTIQQINAYLDRLRSLVELGVISPPARR